MYDRCHSVFVVLFAVCIRGHQVKIKELFDNWSLKGLKINLKLLELDWEPADAEKQAAWDLYVELITRVSTQNLVPEHGDEKSALESLHALFDITRVNLKTHGRHCEVFSRIAIVVLNQKIRPFTTKWHTLSREGVLETSSGKKEFRAELKAL